MDKYIKELEGISYGEWIKLRSAMDRYFDVRKKELERQIQLTSSNEIEKFIHSQFG